MHLVRTLHCIPLSLLNVTKKNQCWPWMTQTLDFVESFLEAWVCNWVQGLGGWLWRCSHKGARLQKGKAEDTHTNKTTHTLKQLWAGGHPWAHVMKSRTNRKATAGSVGTLWGFRTAASTTRLAQTVQARSSKTPCRCAVQSDHLQQGTSNPWTSWLQCWHYSESCLDYRCIIVLYSSDNFTLHSAATVKW